jgi:hypothetical protein
VEVALTVTVTVVEMVMLTVMPEASVRQQAGR